MRSPDTFLGCPVTRLQFKNVHDCATRKRLNERTRRSLAPLPDVSDRPCRDGPPELVIRGKRPVMPVPMLAQWWHKISEPVEELKSGKFAAAAGSRPRGFSAAAGPDPVGGFVPRQHVADASDPAVCTAPHGEEFWRKRRLGTVPQEMLQGLTRVAPLETKERDPDEKRRWKTSCFPGVSVGVHVGGSSDRDSLRLGQQTVPATNGTKIAVSPFVATASDASTSMLALPAGGRASRLRANKKTSGREWSY